VQFNRPVYGFVSVQAALTNEQYSDKIVTLQQRQLHKLQYAFALSLLISGQFHLVINITGTGYQYATSVDYSQ
jgi:hypothetical protein